MTKTELASAGLRTFFRIAARWSLTCEEQQVLLGGPARGTLLRWRAAKEVCAVDRDVIERISYVIGVYKLLHVLFPDATQADAWLRRPNAAPLFAGTTALDRMLRGHMSDLREVREYLEEMVSK